MIDSVLLKKLLCVAVVVTAMVPLGWLVYPQIEHALTGLQFNTIEAVLGATLGLGLYGALYG